MAQQPPPPLELPPLDDEPPGQPGARLEPAPRPGAPRDRRALSNLGGQIHLQGATASVAPLREALEGLELEPAALLTHGFHTYPARLHPMLVRRLLARFAKPGDTVLDPFAGGGTTVLEALVHGCLAIGTDINPVALRIAKVRTLRWPDARIDAFVALTADIAEAAFQDARQRVAPTLSAVAKRQSRWYAPHVLLELQSLFNRIDGIEAEGEYEAALMVFSSILVKVSRQASDTRQVQTDRQVGRGTASRLFGRKAEELGRMLKEVSRAIPPGTPPPILRRADARELPGEDDSIDLIITSPPYAGTYDYASHQDRRFDWLGEDPAFSHEREIGARRHHEDPRAAWIEDEREVIEEMARVLRPGGRAFIVTGDGLLEGSPFFEDEAIGRAAEAAGLRVLGVASQDRPHFNERTKRAFGRRPRREHLISLRKGGRT